MGAFRDASTTLQRLVKRNRKVDIESVFVLRFRLPSEDRLLTLGYVWSLCFVKLDPRNPNIGFSNFELASMFAERKGIQLHDGEGGTTILRYVELDRRTYVSKGPRAIVITSEEELAEFIADCSIFDRRDIALPEILRR